MKHWAEKDERLPCPLSVAAIIGVQQEIMYDLYGPIYHDTDVSIEMVIEAEKVMRQQYKPRWLDIIHRN